MASVWERKWTTSKGEKRSAWVVDYVDEKGRTQRFTPKSGLQRDAKREARRIETEIESGIHVVADKDLTLKAIADQFLANARQRQADGKIGKGRLVNLEIHIRKAILPHLGHVKFSELSAARIEDWYRDVREADGKSVLGMKAIYFDLRMIETFAVKRGYTVKTPVRDAWKELAGGRVEPIRTFQIEEVKRILVEASRIRYAARTRSATLRACYVNLAAFAGLRFGEISGLRVENIDFINRVIRVRNSLSKHDGLKGPKTRAGIRDVPMAQPLVPLLRTWLDDHYTDNPDGLAFILSGGKTIDNRSFHKAHWRPLLKWAGLGDERIHFHALRHFASSLMIKSGLYSMPEVASMLGHNSYDTTLQIYAHPISNGQGRVAVMDKMAGLLTEAPLLEHV